MIWNHRVVKTDEGVMFAEVFYRDSDKKPFGHTDIFSHGDGIEELKELAARLLKATELPILDPATFVNDDNNLEQNHEQD